MVAGNKMIAEFLGKKVITEDAFRKLLQEQLESGVHFTPDCYVDTELTYHESLDALMPALVKIGGMYHRIKFEMDEGFPFCEIWCYKDGELVNEIRYENDTLPLTIYGCIVQFLFWLKYSHIAPHDITNLDLRSDFENLNVGCVVFTGGTLSTGGWYIDAQDYETGDVHETYIYESESEWKKDVELVKADVYELS